MSLQNCIIIPGVHQLNPGTFFNLARWLINLLSDGVVTRGICHRIRTAQRTGRVGESAWDRGKYNWCSHFASCQGSYLLIIPQTHSICSSIIPIKDGKHKTSSDIFSVIGKSPFLCPRYENVLVKCKGSLYLALVSIPLSYKNFCNFSVYSFFLH